MQYDAVGNLSLYLLRNTLITFFGGRHIQGTLMSILQETNKIIVDNEEYFLSDISDIEMTGILAYHTYAANSNRFCDIDGLYFGLDSFVPGTDYSKIIYGEFNCIAACHLSFSDSQIRAQDVRILSFSHKINAPMLAKSLYMYILQEQAPLIGTLQKTDNGYGILTPSGTLCNINFDYVLDIIRIPLINESVIITIRDGSTVSGTVSTANDCTIILLSDTPHFVNVVDILTIRYKGTISIGTAKPNNTSVKQIKLSLGVKDEAFLCKIPYLHSHEDEASITHGAIATFIPGVTDRGLIAKDVILEQAVVDTKEQEYYGVLLTVDFSKENGVGYIGNRYVAKSSGKPVSGNTRFLRSQMNFAIEYNKAYIIKYTATESTDKSLRIVNQMQVHQILDISKLGIIEVSDDGTVNTIPLFRTGIDRFANRDVDVVCSDGRTISGLLQSFDDVSVTIVQGVHEAEQISYVVPFDLIEDILLIGTVTQFYSNGTGYVDNAFFFHINEMEKAVDAQFVRIGTQLIFSLRNARKGNFVDCGNIRVLHEKKLDVYVLAYHDKKYTVVNADKYGQHVRFLDHTYEVPYSSYNQFRDLENEDYHAVLTLMRKAGVTECAYIRTLTNHPKLRRGIVTNVDKENNTVAIVPPEQYRKSNHAVVYPLAPRSGIECITNPDKHDYDVLYFLSVQDREYCASISWANQKNTYAKCHFGYLESYWDDKEYGFITPEAFYGQRNKPWNCGIYCRPSAFVDPPEDYELVDTKYIFRVCYTLAPNNVTKHERPPAQNVWFLEKQERQVRPAPVPAPEPPALIPVVVEDIDLNAVYQLPETEGVNWHYGIVTAYKQTFSSIRIFKDFKNKKVCDNGEEFMQQTLMEVPTGEIPIQFCGEYAENINTKNFTYLVRFAAFVTEEGVLSFDYQYPLEFLQEFRKTTLRMLSVDANILHVETGPIVAKPTPLRMPNPDPIPVPKGVTSYIPGETILFQQEDHVWCAGTVKTADENLVTLMSGQVLNSEEIQILRFGVLSSFNENMTIGYLNGRIPFSFANMEARTFNMIKTAKKQQLLWYTCQNDIVTHVERITNDFLDQLPFLWQYGTVTEYLDNNDTRCVVVNDHIRYLLTVATRGYIWGLIKSGSILEKAVFVKIISCPYGSAEDIEIRQYALDIHSEQEISLIRYDAVADNYLAAQNANSTQSVVVEGNRNMLSSLVDAQTIVSYRITEDGKRLRAFIDKPESDLDWVEDLPEEDLEVSKILMDSSLVQFQLGKVDLTEMQIPGDVILSEDGWPVDHKNAVRLIRHLAKQSGKTFDFKKNIAVIALLEQLPEERKEETLKELECHSVEALLWRFMNRQVRTLGLQNDCIWGEYSYYLTTLLRDIHSIERQKEEIYKLFLQDFYSRIEVMEVLRQMPNNPRERRKTKYNLQTLFKRNVFADNIGQLVAHMISLDETSIQHLIITEDIFVKNPDLTNRVLEWGKAVDNTQNFDSAAVLMDHLRALYKNDKNRYTRDLTNTANSLDVIKSAERILKNISGRYLLLLNADDVQRFVSLHDICQLVISNRYAGYHRYQSALAAAWAKCSDLLHNAEKHLTQETTDMLLKTGLMEAVLREIGEELNSLYCRPDYAPDVRCTSNDSEVAPTQKNLILLVENGTPGRTNLQSAYNIKLHLEVLGGLSADSIPSLITLPEKVLPAGADTVVLDSIPIDLSTLDGDVFSISISAEYECCSGFDNGEIRETRTADCGILEFQLLSGQNIVKNPNAENYYLHPAEGNPLKETSKDDCSMFFGRKEELENIWDSIVDENQVLREGRAIMLYGQKKCGKTSLINQIIGRMKSDPSVSQQAIVISIRDILEFNGGVTGLSSFSLNFYQNILNMLKVELLLHHKDVKQMLSDNGLEIPNLRKCPNFEAAEFQNFFLQFSALDQGKHRVVLVMDEFTRLCTTILERKDIHPEYQGIPNFIKLFSSMGFVQIIIGHPNMMRALSQLGIINHTAEFAKRIELSGLKEADARQLICEPMVRSFGYDVYQTVLGKRAIEKLLALSGCHPSVLMKLCDQMFKHFVTTSHSQILIHDVEKMLHAYLPQLEASTTFDIMVAEDGDATAFFNNLPTYRYLKTVATESLRSNNRDCDINFISPELGEDGSKEIREILISRRVLEVGNGRIRIPIELFLEYIRYMYETH